jgi:tRNA-dihydrouridine synthase
MAQVSYDEVNLMLRLYDMRREPRLRQARAWFVENFHPKSAEEMIEKYPQGSEENTYIRMVISYWDMVASIVNRGLINDELFFESNGEIWVVWDRMRGIVPIWRSAFKNPRLFANIEETYKRLETWREKQAPGSSAAMRSMMAEMKSKFKDG